MTHPDSDALAAMYRRWRANSGAYFRWQAEQFLPHVGRRVADIGCGMGNLTQHFLDRDLYLAIDIDEAKLREVEAAYQQAPALRLLCADISESSFEERLRQLGVDSILSINVIEHLADDRAAVAAMVGALPIGGVLCLLVPAHALLYGTFDKLDGHCRRYNKDHVKWLLNGLPARLRQIYYFNAIGALGWFVKGRVLRQTTILSEDYQTIDRLVPFLRRLEAAFHPPFGLSLVAVIERVG